MLQPRQEDRVTLVLDLGALTMGTIMNKEVNVGGGGGGGRGSEE